MPATAPAGTPSFNATALKTSTTHRGRPLERSDTQPDLTAVVRPRKQNEIGELETAEAAMKGTASPDTPPVTTTGTASSATPHTSSPAVAARVVPRPGQQHIPPRVEKRGPQRERYRRERHLSECSGSFMASVSGASM